MTVTPLNYQGPLNFLVDTAASIADIATQYLDAGAVVWCLDTNEVQIYNGTSWSIPSSRIYLKEDFLGIDVTAADNATTVITQSGTPTTPAAIGTAAGGALAGHGGWLAGSVDNIAAEIDEVALGQKPFCLVSAIPTVARCEIGFVIPTALTARHYFFGWTDDETEGTTTNGSLNIDGTTNVVGVADDAAGFIFSSLATDADGFYYGNVNATTAIADGVVSGLTGVVDEYIRLRVDLDSTGAAKFYGATDTTRTATLPLLGSLSSAVATTALLLPLFSAAATANTAVEWEIDYMEASIS